MHVSGAGADATASESAEFSNCVYAYFLSCYSYRNSGNQSNGIIMSNFNTH